MKNCLVSGWGVIIIGFVLGVVVNLGLWLFNVGCLMSDKRFDEIMIRIFGATVIGLAVLLAIRFALWLFGIM